MDSILASYSHPRPQQLCSLASIKYIKIYEILRAVLQKSTFILRTKHGTKGKPQPPGCWPASSLPGTPAHVPPIVSPSSLFIDFQLQDFPLTRWSIENKGPYALVHSCLCKLLNQLFVWGALQPDLFTHTKTKRSRAHMASVCLLWRECSHSRGCNKPSHISPF